MPLDLCVKQVPSVTKKSCEGKVELDLRGR